MPESTSVQSILDAADQAAAAGDIRAAEQLLRQAIQLQEAELGPHHSDLANTLNNLGVVCEQTGRLDEAEACYRRAHDIAAAAFEPDHPFVITSRKNLADFCKAHGKAIEPVPAAAPAPPAPPSPPVRRPTVERPISEHSPHASKQLPPPVPRSRPLVIALIALAAVLVFGMIVFMRRSSEPAESEAPAPAAAPVESAPPRVETPNNSAPVASDPGAAPKEARPRSATPSGGSVPETRAGSARATTQPTVAEAQVCRRFSTAGSRDWRCEQAGPSVAPGSLVYYTRIKAARATTVEHRWYLGDDLQQRVLLDVAANPSAGYRTFSRLAVSAAGRWRVEVRTEGGAVLHEARFTVR